MQRPLFREGLPQNAERVALVKIVIVYVHPLVSGYDSMPQAARFVATYHLFAPGHAHETVIVCNGGKPTGATRVLFGSLPSVSFFEHDNSGWDVGAFQAVAAGSAADLLLCFGASAHFHRSGWLLRMAQAAGRHGPGLYGSMATNQVRPHIRTNGFACPPGLIRRYPVRCLTKDDRYSFEHGDRSLTEVARRSGLHPLLISWDGEFPVGLWRRVDNGYHAGNQTNVLVWDNHTEGYFNASELEQRRMTMLASGL